MSEFRIDQENLIEVVGTQYEGRNANHKGLKEGQILKLVRQPNNPFDENAILVCTEKGKPLGFIPKGQAALYAEAIDRKKYKFTATIHTARPDANRPILMVTIKAVQRNISRSETEAQILSFAQRIFSSAQEYAARYQGFVTVPRFTPEEVISCLYDLRFYNGMQTLLQSHQIQPELSEQKGIAKDAVSAELTEISYAVDSVLKIIKQQFNDAADIDDEDEYEAVVRKTRADIKIFQNYKKFCAAASEYCESADTAGSSSPEQETTSVNTQAAVPAAENQPVHDVPEHTETLPQVQAVSEQPEASEMSLTKEAEASLPQEETIPPEAAMPAEETPVQGEVLIPSGPFVLENALREILASSDVRVKALRGYRNGLNPDALRKLLKDIYGQNIIVFRIIAAIVKAPDIISVGKQHYLLDKKAQPEDVKETETAKSAESEIEKPEESEEKKSDEPEEREENGHTSQVTIADLEKMIVDLLYRHRDDVLCQEGMPVRIIRNLIADMGVGNLSDEAIECILKSNSSIREVDEGYYAYAEPEHSGLPAEETVLPQPAEPEQYEPEVPPVQPEADDTEIDTSPISFVIGQRSCQAFDCTEALMQICEYAIRVRPFVMAGIDRAGIMLHGKEMFYRTAVPVPQCRKLSNGIQLHSIRNRAELNELCRIVLQYCQIDEAAVRIEN